jgi:hypothetical protein
MSSSSYPQLFFNIQIFDIDYGNQNVAVQVNQKMKQVASIKKHFAIKKSFQPLPLYWLYDECAFLYT